MPGEIEKPKPEESIDIKKLDDGNFEIVRTIREVVPAEAITSFFAEIKKAMENTQANLDAMPEQAKVRKEVLQASKVTLEKRFKTFEPFAKAIEAAKPKPPVAEEKVQDEGPQPEDAPAEGERCAPSPAEEKAKAAD